MTFYVSYRYGLFSDNLVSEASFQNWDFGFCIIQNPMTWAIPHGTVTANLVSWRSRAAAHVACDAYPFVTQACVISCPNLGLCHVQTSCDITCPNPGLWHFMSRSTVSFRVPTQACVISCPDLQCHFMAKPRSVSYHVKTL